MFHVAHPAVSIPQVEHVRQVEDWDCGVACLAMLAGLSYDEARRIVTTLPRRRWEHGITRLTMRQLLGQRGLALMERRRRTTAPAWELNLAEVTHEPGDCFHWVVLLGDGTVHDPLEDVPYPPVPHGWEVPLTAMGYHRVLAVAGIYPFTRPHLVR